MVASTSGVLVDDNVVEVLKKAQLEAFVNKFIFNLHVRRFDHCLNIREKDMFDIGMQPHQIRSYREQVQKMHREMWNRSAPKQIYIQSDVSNANFESALNDRTLIPKEQIKLYEKLGEGSFAVVKRGIWIQNYGRKLDVAIKILRDASPMVIEDLRVEASHLLKLHHPSLIRLYGIVQQPAMMVFELCEGGSLLDRLRDDNKSILLVSVLLDYSVQIAKALQFLESKHCLHRDVAARNILLSKDEKAVKICDFGLMRDLKDNEQMYTMAPQKKVPFAWCAPESLSHRKFSHASDVWSYGVTIWELFTYGEEPWAGCRAVDVLNNIKGGERLEKPKYCSQKIYQIMLNCWKSEPSERCKFGAIREDLKSATFLDAIVREPYKSIQPGCLQLNVSDEIIVIENGNEDWFGQSKKTLHFGNFPRGCVFVQSNHAANSVPAVTPQKIPAVSQVRLAQDRMPKNIQEAGNHQAHSGMSRISMPVIGSFIHTGHGDPLGGQSWGSPSTIDVTYLKNPVKGVPMGRSQNGADIVKSKFQLTNGENNSQASASSQQSTLSLQLPDLNDEFEKAFNDSFSPSAIEYPRSFGVNNNTNVSNITVISSNEMGTTLLESKNERAAFDIRGNLVLQPTRVDSKPKPFPVLQPISNANLTTGSGLNLTNNFVAPTSIQNNSLANGHPRHISSVGANLNNLGNGISQADCLMTIPSTSAINSELKVRMDSTVHVSRPRPASSIGIQLSQENSSLIKNPSSMRPISMANMPIIQPSKTPITCLIPTPAPLPKAESKTLAQPTELQKALAEELKGSIGRKPSDFGSTVCSQNVSNGSSVRLPTPPMNSAPAAVSKPCPTISIPKQSQPRHASQPSQPTASHVPTNSASNNGEISNTETSNKPPTTSSKASTAAPKPIKSSAKRLSDEERRSQIAAEVTSLLPAPSSLLLGSTTVITNTTRSVSVTHPSSEITSTAANINPPPKKGSEPVLSLNSVLQPTRISSSGDVRSSSTSDLQRMTTNERITANKVSAPDVPNFKKNELPVQQSQVPLFNITNSQSQITYPHLMSYSSYGNGLNSGYGIYGGYNSSSYMRPQNSYPPLLPTENRASPVITQPLNPSDIDEFLGTTSRSQQRQATPPSDISMTNRMEVLYREAHFTQKSNCDAMVSKCNGNVELALKRLKQQHLLDIGLALNIENAERALESHNYDLTAAANMLLG